MTLGSRGLNKEWWQLKWRKGNGGQFFTFKSDDRHFTSVSPLHNLPTTPPKEKCCNNNDHSHFFSFFVRMSKHCSFLFWICKRETGNWWLIWTRFYFQLLWIWIKSEKEPKKIIIMINKGDVNESEIQRKWKISMILMRTQIKKRGAY